MSDLATNENGYIYISFPEEWKDVYDSIVIMLADFGEDMLKDCKAACTKHNSDVVDCFNMFNAAVAAKELSVEDDDKYDKLADTLIKYIRAKIKHTYRLSGDDSEDESSDSRIHTGDSSHRPTLNVSDAGYQYFDTTLSMLIIWNGTAWQDTDSNLI